MGQNKNKYYYSDGTASSRCINTKTLHREDGPAAEWVDGTKAWYINGKPIVYYRTETGNYELYDDADTVITEEQARLLLAKHGVRI